LVPANNTVKGATSIRIALHYRETLRIHVAKTDNQGTKHYNSNNYSLTIITIFIIDVILVIAAVTVETERVKWPNPSCL
jgi:uncharacterized membrane protein affecting hemolysin expression